MKHQETDCETFQNRFEEFTENLEKLLNEEGESRNSLRCAVVVQGRATQWIPS